MGWCRIPEYNHVLSSLVKSSLQKELSSSFALLNGCCLVNYNNHLSLTHSILGIGM